LLSLRRADLLTSYAAYIAIYATNCTRFALQADQMCLVPSQVLTAQGAIEDHAGVYKLSTGSPCKGGWLQEKDMSIANTTNTTTCPSESPT